MATVALCPNCGSQLGVPVAASDAPALVCPLCESQFPREAALLHELPMARVVAIDQHASFDPDWRLSDHFRASERSASSTSVVAGGIGHDSITSTATATPTEPSTNGDSITAAAIAAEAARLEELLRNLPAEAGALTSPPSVVAAVPQQISRDERDPAADEEAPPVAALPHDDVTRGLDYQTLDNPSTNVDEELETYNDVDEADYDEAAEDDFSEEGEYDEDDDAESSHRAHRQFVLRPSPKRRPRTSAVRSLVGIVGGGAVGLLLAGYALIWLRGPQLDVFRMAAWVPAVMLPESMQKQAGNFASESRASDQDETELSFDEQFASQDEAEDSDDARTGGSSPDSASPIVVDDPAVMPANHTAAARDEALGADGSDITPTRAEPAPAEPLPNRNWPASPIVGDLIAPHLYSIDDLTKAVVPAEGAARKFMSGDFASAESQKAMGHAYIKLCAVAERYTLTDPNEYGSRLFTQQLLGKGPLQSVAGNTSRRSDLARITAKWWSYPKRHNQGILAVGRVTELHPQGSWTVATLAVEGAQPPLEIPVLMDGVRFTTGADVAVAGVIVQEPQEHIKDYQGTESRVVVGGYLFDPAKFAESPTTP